MQTVPHLLPITCGLEYMVQAKLLDAPNVRWWFSFLGLFRALFDKNHDLFYVTDIFDTLVSHEKVSSSLTGCSFGVTASRLDLTRMIDYSLILLRNLFRDGTAPEPARLGATWL